MQADGAEPVPGDEAHSRFLPRPKRPEAQPDSGSVPVPRTTQAGPSPDETREQRAAHRVTDTPTAPEGPGHANSLAGNAHLTGNSIQARDVQKIIVNHPPATHPPPPPSPAPPSPPTPEESALVMRVDLGGETIEFFDESVARIFINVRWGNAQ